MEIIDTLQMQETPDDEMRIVPQKNDTPAKRAPANDTRRTQVIIITDDKKQIGKMQRPAGFKNDLA